MFVVLFVMALAQGRWTGNERYAVLILFCGVFGIFFVCPPSLIPASSVFTMNWSTLSSEVSTTLGHAEPVEGSWQGVTRLSSGSKRVASDEVEVLDDGWNVAGML